jgi:cytochrome c551/c552
MRKTPSIRFASLQWLVLVLLATALLAPACNKQSGDTKSGASAGSGASTTTANLAQEGQAIYDTAGCVKCHGTGLSGGSAAPALQSMALYWNAKQLEEYMADPATYVQKDSRLKEQAAKYPMMMPAVPDEQKRQVLAKWLLALPNTP